MYATLKVGEKVRGDYGAEGELKSISGTSNSL